jgi:EmrB/QacA subfamily drug resistance transporter
MVRTDVDSAMPDVVRRGGRPEHGPWVTFAVLAVAQFMIALDVSIVYVALPSIQRQMGFSETDLAWVMDAYILAFAGIMLLGGRAADLFGRRRVLFVGLTWFGLASLACGLSAEAWQIVAARAAQGLGAAIVAPAALALVTDTFAEGPDRFKALGIFGSIGGFAGATGVLFGGLLTSISWQWAFLVNVPIVLGVLVTGARVLPARPPTASGGMDVAGALASAGGLCLLLFALLRGGVQGWGSPAVTLELVGAAVLLAAFAVRQLSAKAPLIPRLLFRMRNVVLGNAVNTLTGALLFGVFFVLTLYLQVVRGYTPLGAALWTMPISVSLFFGSNVIGRLLGRISPVDALGVGMAIQAVGLAWWAASLGATGGMVTSFLLPAMVWSFGCGAAIVAAFVACTSGLHGPVMGAASGVVSTTLQVGGALGVATLSVLADRQVGLAGAVERANAMAAGQSVALWAAAGIAAIGIPVALWLRGSWPATGSGGHATGDGVAGESAEATAPGAVTTSVIFWHHDRLELPQEGRRPMSSNHIVLDKSAQDVLFRAARTAKTFTDEPVSDEQIAAVYDLVKWAPTSFNQQPLRVVLVRSAEARSRLIPLMWDSNQSKTAAAPLTAVLAADIDFHEHLPAQFPVFPQAKDVFFATEEARVEAATLNATLQVAYFILGVRSVGLAAGPMTGFYADKVTEEFFPGGRHRPLVVVNIGRPGPDAWYDRLPRLGFADVFTAA